MLALLFMISGPAFAAGPYWTTHNTFQKRPGSLKIVCEGQGGELGDARSQAISSCVQAASQQLPSTWQVSSDSQETDRDVSLKRQVLADERVEGVNCDVKNEFVEETDRTLKVYIQCYFDLRKAKTVALNLREVTRGRAIRVTTVPACDHIDIWGGPYARTVMCDNGEATIPLIPGEHTIEAYTRYGNLYKEFKIPQGVSYQEVTLHLEKGRD